MGKIALLMGILVLISVTSSEAAVITFDSVPSVGNPLLTSLTTQGFTFTSGHFHTVDNPGGCVFGGCVTNGTHYLAIDGPALGFGLPVTMALAGGGTFSLNGLDGDKLFMDDAAASAGGFPNATEIDVTGSLFGGGTVFAALHLSGGAAFQTFTLPGTFTNLTSVVFQGNADDSIAVDNIVVSSPEPSAILLLGPIMVLGLAFGRRFAKTLT
jgi:hypothetical protein